MTRKAKIVCTIGPASRDVDTLRRLIRGGMDVARLNFSHGDIKTHHENVERIRAVAEEEGAVVAILVDLQGPKFRLGRIDESGVDVHEGQDVSLTVKKTGGQSSIAFPVQNKRLVGLVSRGDRILIDDGLIECKVLSTTDTEVHCRVITGGTVKSNKGINLPGISADLPSITKKDRVDLLQALSWGVDWVALSFVRTAKDIKVLRRFIKHQTDLFVPVMAKIEKPEALKNIDEIIDVSDGIMVARGDLGIEIDIERVPTVQKRIIKQCNEKGVPVVTATQMLDSMIRNSRPTRAEASDVANAILDGTDAVMLSGETTIGRYPVKTVGTMVKIIRDAEAIERDVPNPSSRTMERNSNGSPIAMAIGHASRDIADGLGIAGIIAVTVSGYTARIVSQYRPHVPIFAVTPEKRVQRQLQLHWGVKPLHAARSHNTDEMINNAIQAVRDAKYVKAGDLVAITAGTAGSEPGTTNLIRILAVE